MGSFNRFRQTFVGGFLGTSLVGLLGALGYSCKYCVINNPYQSYNPGRSGVIGALAYVIAVTSAVSLVLFLIGVILLLLKQFKTPRLVIFIVGIVIWAVCFICEAIFISWNNWTLLDNTFKVIQNDYSDYQQAFQKEIKVAYYDFDYNYDFDLPTIAGMSDFAARSPPTYGVTTALIDKGDGPVTEKIGMPVCYFKNETDKTNFKPEKCIGKWNGKKLKSFMKELNKQMDEDQDRKKWDQPTYLKWKFLWNMHSIVMYSHIGAFSFLPLFFGIQIVALVLGVIAFLLFTVM